MKPKQLVFRAVIVAAVLSNGIEKRFILRNAIPRQAGLGQRKTWTPPPCREASSATQEGCSTSPLSTLSLFTTKETVRE